MAAKGRPVSASRSSKVAGKLQEKIREGNYYEALQTYRALYQRYSAQGREKDARDLLHDGASLLLRHNQVFQLIRPHQYLVNTLAAVRQFKNQQTMTKVPPGREFTVNIPTGFSVPPPRLYFSQWGYPYSVFVMGRCSTCWDGSLLISYSDTIYFFINPVCVKINI